MPDLTPDATDHSPPRSPPTSAEAAADRELLDRDREELTSLFKLLSDGTRLNILMMLAPGELNVTSLCEALDLPQPTVSHHLGLLRMNNIVSNRRSGKQVFYGLDGRVDRAPNDELMIVLDNHVVTISPRPIAERRRPALAHKTRNGTDGQAGK